MADKLKIGILGATGMVGQRFVSLLNNHPWFEVVCVAASPRSKGKKYTQAVGDRWSQSKDIPGQVANLVVLSVEEDVDQIVPQVDFVFSAIDMEKTRIREVEELYASKDIPVVSNNSAHRWTDDVPMIMPEINPEHVELIGIQRQKRGWKKGLIVVKPNCSIQSYVPIIKALEKFAPKKVSVSTYQAISGAGKTFQTWPEIVDNVVPYIGGEEAKSEDEPMKIFGEIVDDKIEPAIVPVISASCIRVPVSDGHLATVSIEFENKPTKEQVLDAINNFVNPIEDLNLPSSPERFIKYFEEDNRPQTKLDRDYGDGMGVAMGRLREDPLFDYKFVTLSHNTIRGAAGGAILVAELLKAKGYIG